MIWSVRAWSGSARARATKPSTGSYKVLSDYQKAPIRTPCRDMSQAYGAIEDHCPNTTRVLDRFHIVRPSTRRPIRCETNNGEKHPG